MDTIWTPKGKYVQKEFSSERDLEDSIRLVEGALFGEHRVYLDVKKVIGARSDKKNIPDGYLFDLSGRKPRLFVVENERANHHVLKHIAVQILEFSLAFESDKRVVRHILFQALQRAEDKKRLCEEYAISRNFRNLDHFLDHLVFESPFAALVVIDRKQDNLETVLSKKFAFGVKILELRRYENDAKKRIYAFEPFLSDVEQDIRPSTGSSRISPVPVDVDTIVVPAREPGFQETFMRENRWHEIRINSIMLPQIKYIAVYRKAPQSAITHFAPVESIEAWKDSGKYVINFAKPAEAIGPIKLIAKGRVKAPQNVRYTTMENLQSAKTLDELW